MSKVKIQGHASGTGVLTVTAPNTSTDRTITLPDGTGTLLTTDGDGSSLTGVGVDGISSSADATAITIDSDENVGIGVTPESDWTTGTDIGVLQIGKQGSLYSYSNGDTHLNDNAKWTGSNWKYINTDHATNFSSAGGAYTFNVAPSGTADATISWTDALEITNDGRGLSQFTAKAWANFDSNPLAERDSHNVSSYTDNGEGWTKITFTNSLANTNYSCTGMCNDISYGGNLFIYGSTGNAATSSIDVRVRDGNANVADADTICIQVFGD